MNREKAKEKALLIFNKWNSVTGVFGKDTGYFFEIQSVIEDAVEIGFSAGKNISKNTEKPQKKESFYDGSDEHFIDGL